jgi:glycosyltransferase involved in cell wall biosynthesis
MEGALMKKQSMSLDGRSPQISLLLPVRDGMRYLPEAMASIEAQTFRNFEAVVVDDGSVDGSGEWLEQQAVGRWSWLRIVRQPQAGVAGALNRGWAECRGEFIARMDGDDIAHPTRLQRQIDFLRANPSVGMVGSWVRTFGGGRCVIWRYPVDDAAIRARLIFESPFAHPAVMLRRTAVDDGAPPYRAAFPRAQDYDLWERLRERCGFANLPLVLLHYRIHEQQATATGREAMLTAAEEVRSRMLAKWWPESSSDDRLLHHKICSGLSSVTDEEFARAERWLRRLTAHHRQLPLVPDEAWRKAITVKWWEVCRHFRMLGWPVFSRFVASPLLQPTAIPIRRWARLFFETAHRRGRVS